MKRKRSKVSTEDLILSKAQKYVNEPAKSVCAIGAENAVSGKQLRKATEADKERKREKARLKRQKKRELKLLENSNESSTAALSYLHVWDTDRSHWTFKKNKQCWLLRNVFSEKISDEDFLILLRYIVCLQGAALNRLVTEAENIVKKEISEDHDEKEMAHQKLCLNRAKDILQILV